MPNSRIFTPRRNHIVRRMFRVIALSLPLVVATQALAAKVDITINKVSQKMTIAVDGDVKYVWPVSTGGSGYDTPSGKFRPFRMEEDHYSAEWDNAPMPHSIFFTGEGHAIHGTVYSKSLGRRASHGCVRLSQDNASKLFSLVGANGMKNTSVVIKGGFFDFDFADDGPVLPKGFKLGSKRTASNDTAITAKKKKKRFFLFGKSDG
jgi:L,D-transpeptidase catalytic domain